MQSPARVRRVNEARPCASSPISTARTSAPWAVPKVMIRALVRSAIAATRGSSALRTATPPSAAEGRAATSSPLAFAVGSGPPNSPIWAVPTLRTTPTVGGVISVR